MILFYSSRRLICRLPCRYPWPEMGYCCLMPCLLCRCCHPDRSDEHSTLRRWSCFCGSRCWFSLHFGSDVSVRVLPQVDPWFCRRSVPVGYHHWAPPL